MARISSFRRIFDVGPLIEAAKQLDSVDLATSLADVMNESLREFEVSTRRAMVQRIALSAAYVEGKTKRTAATSASLKATVEVGGDLVILGHYSPLVQYKTVGGKRPPKGDPSRGVPAGARSTGVQVTIKPGSPKVIPGAFTMRLKRGTDQGDKVGVFTRNGSRKLHRYGVAPYSLFRYQIDQQQDEFMDKFQGEALDRIIDQYGRTVG